MQHWVTCHRKSSAPAETEKEGNSNEVLGGCGNITILGTIGNLVSAPAKNFSLDIMIYMLGGCGKAVAFLDIT